MIHQIRNSTKYVSYKDIKAVMADLKLVYGAPTLEDAEYRLEEFREKWETKYPQILKSWEANWAELSTYFKYPHEVRRLIYTTNAVEGFHRMLRKFTKTKTIYPTDEAVKNRFIFRYRKSLKMEYANSRLGNYNGAADDIFEDRLQGKMTS